MTIRAYHWDDPGAPVLPNISSQRAIDNIRIILKACLVDGYGDKPGAGWTLGHDLPDGFSLGNGNGWLNVVYRGVSSVTVYIIEEITDFSTPEAEGVNKRSGYFSEGYESESRMRPRMPSIQGTHNGGLAWYVIADERTATFMISATSSESQFIVDPTSSNGFGWHFGDYIKHDGTPGFVAMCGDLTTNSNGTTSAYWAGSGTGVLRNPFTGLVDQGSRPNIRALIGSHMSTSSLYSLAITPLLDRIQFARAGLIAGDFPGSSSITSGTPVGTLRGVLYSTELSNIFSEVVLKSVFGLESPQAEDKFRPLPNIIRPDHPGLYMAYPNISDMGAFISLDPEDWE